MAFYSGEVALKDLFSTVLGHITAVQAGQKEPWWKKESSIDSDGVYTSTGSTGAERIVLVFREVAGSPYFIVGTARDYTPGVINQVGAFDNLETQNVYSFSSNVDQANKVKYDVSVTPDRVIIHVQGDKLVSSYENTVVYLGMPIRYDVNDKKCVVHASSEQSMVNNALRVVEDSVGAVKQSYTWYYVASPGNPSWGNSFFIETLHFGKGAEGLRGEIDGLYATNPSGLVDGDEIDINGTRYLVIVRRAVGSNSFPREVMLMRKS